MSAPVCTYCDRLAVVNFQKLWVRWPIHHWGGGDWGFGKRFQMVDEQTDITQSDNVYCCEVHRLTWERGEV